MVRAQLESPYRYGTAYALSDRIFVTARHVWFGTSASSRVAQRALLQVMDEPLRRDWRSAHVCWEDAERDVCLLQLDRDAPSLHARYEPRFGYYDRSRAVPWEGAGFPGAARVATESGSHVREVADASGLLGAAGGMRLDRLALTVGAGPSDANSWEGMSGAPVFADQKLVAIIVGVLDAFVGRRLDAAPLAPMLLRGEVQSLLGTRRLYQVPSGILAIDEPLDAIPADAPPSVLLHAKNRVIPFDSTVVAREFQTVSTWLEAEHSKRMLLLTARGGTGKTRFALEYCEELQRKGWQAGFLRSGLRESVRAEIADDPRPTLVCIDYADARPTLSTELKSLLADAVHRTQPLRVLLLARNVGDWWHALLQRVELEELTVGTRPLALRELQLLDEDRQRLLVSSVRVFARILNIDPEKALRGLGQRHELSAPEFGRLLYVAMLALDALSHDSLASTPDQLPGAMLRREEELWLKHRAHDRDDAQQAWLDGFRRTMAVLTLQGGVTSKDAALSLVDRADGPLPAEDTVAVLRRLQPGTGEPESERGYLDPLEPDLLGEALVHRVLSKQSADFAARVLSTVDVNHLRIGFTILGRLSISDPAGVRPWIISALIGSEPATFAQRASSAVDAAIALSQTIAGMDSGLGAILAEQFGSGRAETAELAADILRRIPPKSVSLSPLGAWASTSQVKQVDADGWPVALMQQASALYRAGDRTGALQTIQLAVMIYEAAAAIDPRGFKAPLARSLNDHGLMLRAAGDFVGALDATRRSVMIFKSLVHAGDHSQLLPLAASLGNRSNALESVGDGAGALQAAEEASDIIRRLAAPNDEEQLSDLASILQILSIRRSFVGDNEGALAPGLEAVKIYRSLADAKPDEYQPGLALALNSLIGILSTSGDLTGAVQIGREAVEMYRRLATFKPAAYRVGLANSLNNYTVALQRAGADSSIAVEPSLDSMDIVRELSASATGNGGISEEIADGLSAAQNDLASVLNRGSAPGAMHVGVAEAVDWRAIARRGENGDVDAMMLLGMRAGAQGETALAERWLGAAAAGGHPYSKVLLGGLLAEQGQIDRAVPFWQEADEAGDADASYLLAMLDPSDPGKTSYKVEYRQQNGLYDARVACSVKLNPPRRRLSELGRLLDWTRNVFR